MALKVKNNGYDPSKITLVQKPNGAVIAQSSSPHKQTMVPYDDEAMLERCLMETEKTAKRRGS